MNDRERTGLFLKSIRSLILIVLILFLLSCSGNPPEVNETWWQVNLLVDKFDGPPRESLSLFISAFDDDGEGDIDQLYLINDENLTFWSIPSDLWVTYSDAGINWIGCNNLFAPGEGHFPEGHYRVLLIDLGGERAESSFYLRNSIPQLEDVTLPQIRYDLEQITVLSEFPKFELWFYDEEGNLLEKSDSLLEGSYEWNQIVRNIVDRATSFSLYSEPENSSWGMISGPYQFKS